ncbi:saccharopine dehydrogenase NADP-binding domain-containing protein [Vagococcus sp. BWB3-3]|uniref:Saccharopine dehydrogenase NADP-binding domain-containing protein n=1 Tax=Vagococcus allomyrinae TaxID=2794353 RepID=A0A940PFI4_9ENTE|nr:saccharopine dehydrogenase NADP-binding domain-containing protein [Vagococcus allomyrinae]MBP1043915.1 saccharopine dehydrogenase NADP-binding domain-containing protein [Vagococcus allomyrinae]
MKDKILIVGGHGHVGSVITKSLAENYEDKLVLAGRHLDKLVAFKQKLNLNVGVMSFDIQQPPQKNQFETISLVVVCIDQQTTDFALFCQKQGIDYLDVSASTAFYHQLAQESFDSETGIVYSVGLAPGVTNLMAAKLAQELADFDEMSIKVILGLADQHGEAAVDWTLAHLSESYYLKNQQGTVQAFGEKALVELAGKKLPAYSFNFSDQHSLGDRWPTKKIMTYLGFDVKWVTQTFRGLQRLGLLPLLKRPGIKRLAKGFMRKGALGSDVFYVQVTALKGGIKQKALTVTGYNEAFVTGKVAAFIAEKVYHSEIKGFVQIEDISGFDELLAAIPELSLISANCPPTAS